jgi:ribonuclease HI
MYLLFTDGGSRGNPGKAAAGWAIFETQITRKESDEDYTKGNKIVIALRPQASVEGIVNNRDTDTLSSQLGTNNQKLETKSQPLTINHQPSTIPNQSTHKTLISKNSKYLGIQTNNFAEYSAIVEGLKECIGKDIKELEVRMDSELAVKQINGLYKVKNPQIAIFVKEIFELKKKFKNIKFVHVYREENKVADGMVNECLDKIAKI